MVEAPVEEERSTVAELLFFVEGREWVGYNAVLGRRFVVDCQNGEKKRKTTLKANQGRE